jgi:hypothetical protein
MSDADGVPLRSMGLKPDAPDRRDRLLFQAVPNIDALPDRPARPAPLGEVLDQSAVGGCTGYSTATMCESVMALDGHKRPFVPSPVFLYGEGRRIGGYHGEDAGAELRNVLKAAANLGLPPMSNIKPRFRPGDLADPNTGLFPAGSVWVREPAKSHLADAARRKALKYFKLPTLGDLIQCLADGYPAAIGFEVYRSFYGSGGPKFEVPDPRPEWGDRALGGHAVCAYSYDRPSRRVLIRNSWGETAHQGRPDFTLSFNYLEKYSWDNWTIRYIQGGKPS